MPISTEKVFQSWETTPVWFITQKYNIFFSYNKSLLSLTTTHVPWEVAQSELDGYQVKRVRCERKAQSSREQSDWELKRKAQGSEVTENANAKHEVRGSEAMVAPQE